METKETKIDIVKTKNVLQCLTFINTSQVFNNVINGLILTDNKRKKLKRFYEIETKDQDTFLWVGLTLYRDQKIINGQKYKFTISIVFQNAKQVSVKIDKLFMFILQQINQKFTRLETENNIISISVKDYQKITNETNTTRATQEFIQCAQLLNNLNITIKRYNEIQKRWLDYLPTKILKLELYHDKDIPPYLIVYLNKDFLSMITATKPINNAYFKIQDNTARKIENFIEMQINETRQSIENNKGKYTIPLYKIYALLFNKPIGLTTDLTKPTEIEITDFLKAEFKKDFTTSSIDPNDLKTYNTKRENFKKDLLKAIQVLQDNDVFKKIEITPKDNTHNHTAKFTDLKTGEIKTKTVKQPNTLYYFIFSKKLEITPHLALLEPNKNDPAYSYYELPKLKTRNNYKTTDKN